MSALPTSSDPVPAVSAAPKISTQPVPSRTPSSSASSIDETSDTHSAFDKPERGSRRGSATMIIPRDSKKVELNEDEEEYDEHDVRSMSPKRSIEDVERLSNDAREQLITQAKQLQASLMAIVDRVENVKEEHDKLEGGNKFLQQYIGELIQTTKITSSSAGKSKGKSSGRK